MTWTTHDRDTDHHGTELDSVITLDGDLPYSYGDDGSSLHDALVAIAEAAYEHGMPAAPSGGGVGPLLIADIHSTPLVFDDLLQSDDGDDLLYADV